LEKQVSDAIAERIRELKQQRNAIILVHNYQAPEVQDIADFLGDSLGLSRTAAETDADVIVFCGVHFMAETASILCPDKTVLLPDPEAGCPMADMISGEELRALKRAHPDAVVVCYVNSSAEVKAESDYCCTSANAVDIVRSIDLDREIIFVPDQYLGDYVSQQTAREMILWHGFCPTHVRILDSDVARLKEEHPEAVVMAHPECPRPVRDLADHVLSTSGMCRFGKESDAAEFIVATEIGILHRLRKESPEKAFLPASEAGVCPNMKRIRLEKVLWALQDMQHEIRVPDDIRDRAIRSIDRMLAATG